MTRLRLALARWICPRTHYVARIGRRTKRPPLP